MAMIDTFEDFVAKERERLHKAREAALAKLAEAQAEMGKIDVELSAIDAYVKAKQVKPLAIATPRATGTRKPRETGKRAEVLATITSSDGMTRAEVLEHFRATEKSQQQSISNALAALKKAGQLIQDGRVYRAST
jgi:hypothetical protein